MLNAFMTVYIVDNLMEMLIDLMDLIVQNWLCFQTVVLAGQFGISMIR